MLAILKAGGAYVPIDISYPVRRITLILQDCKPLAILTTRTESQYLPETTIPLIFLEKLRETARMYDQDTLSHASYDDPAYIIYTSGTTGIPKGVIVPHRGVLRLISDQNYINFGPKKIFLQLASLAFDAATFEIWGPLLHGGTCVLYPDSQIPDPTTLQQLIVKEKISTVWLTATLFNTLITANPDSLSDIPEILTGGEALSLPHIRKALTCLPKTKLINGYGPTENTTFTTCYQIPHDIPPDWTSIPIGKPIRQTTIHILDNELWPVTPGDVGELYTGGAGLALGYLNRPKLTAEKFIINPNTEAADKRLYRTGDLVRQLPDGNLDYIGRIDDQVKIRGFRIELGEISTALLTHPNIKDAVVIVYTDNRQSKNIISYIIFRDSQTPGEELREYLTNFLPEYMVPSCYIPLDSIPLNPNGKLDKSRLPQPPSPDNSEYIAPGSKIEKQLAIIWCRLLNLEQISIVDNFFDIGGTSLLGIEPISTINNTFTLAQELNAVILYQFPTIQALGAHLSPQKSAFSSSSSKETRARRQKSAFKKFKRNKRA